MSKQGKKSRRIKDQKKREWQADNPPDSILDGNLRWRCFEDGYRWVDGLDGRWLTGPGDKLTRAAFTEYSPMEESGLFIELAAVEPTEESILQFANKWGMLTRGESFAGLWSNGESLAQWQVAIPPLRTAVNLWRLLEKNDVAEIRKRLEFHKSPTGPDSWEPLWIYKDAERVSNRLTPIGLDVRESDVRTVAALFLQRWINARLHDQTAGCSPQILFDPMRKKHAFRIVPHTLLACAWWRLARALYGEVKFETCPICRREFEITPGIHQGHAIFCSQACRQKDHRRKVNKAKELHAKGKTVKQIATHFDTSPETINNWLTKKK